MNNYINNYRSKIEYRKENISTIRGDIIEQTKTRFRTRNFYKNIIILNTDGKLQHRHKSLFHSKLEESFPIFDKITSTENNNLGSCRLIEVLSNPLQKNKILIANMYCHNLIRNKQKLHYGLLSLSLYSLKKDLETIKKSYIDFDAEIHTTKIGCGTYGGDWKIVSSLISDILENEKVFVYTSN